MATPQTEEESESDQYLLDTRIPTHLIIDLALRTEWTLTEAWEALITTHIQTLHRKRDKPPEERSRSLTQRPCRVVLMEPTQRLHLLHEVGRRQGRYQSKFRARHEPKTRFTKRIWRCEPWESLFMRKSRAEKREIVQKPWEYPMAAQNLAVILIQKRVRGMLTRLWTRRNQLLIPAASSSSVSKPMGGITTRRRSVLRIQSPMQRFIASGHGSYADELEFRSFTATRLQAWYRKEKLRYAYTLERSPVYHIAALQIQYAWKAHCQHKMFKHQGDGNANGISPRLRAVLCIQATWKSYTNKRIYRYYRDLIAFQNTGDPAMMLRAINPAEASLLDASMGAHVRFRLGGMSFPPTIYYKIFTRRAVCDLNAFSPKDYTIARQTAPGNHSKSKGNKFFIRVGNSYYRAKQAEQDMRNWYRRIEHNGWRPVTAKVISEANNDPIALATSKRQVANYHFSKLVRKQDVEKQRRIKKRAWMQKLYMQGLLKETTTLSASPRSDLADGDREHENFDPETIFDVDFENEHWEEDAEDMFQWASALDYDEYVDSWQRLGKTASTDDGFENPEASC